MLSFNNHALPIALMAALLVFGSPVKAADEIDAEKRAVVVELLEVTNAGAVSLQVSTTIMNDFKPLIEEANPGIEPLVLDEVIASTDDVLAQKINEFLEMIVPIYARHFTLEELHAVLAFHKSPVGQKMIEKAPALADETVIVARPWGEELGVQLVAQLTETLEERSLNVPDQLR